MLGIGLNPKVAQQRIAHSNQAVCNTVPQPR